MPVLAGPKTTITANGTYTFPDSPTPWPDRMRPFTMGASSVAAGNTATVQLIGEIAGAVTSIDSALVPVFGTPVAWPGEYTFTGRRAVVVTGIVGSIILEVGQ